MNELRLNDPFATDPWEDMFRGMLRPWRAEWASRAPQIKLDVSEAEGVYTVKADIPGVRKEDVDVQIDGNLVTISAETKQSKDDKKDGRVLRSERQYGYATRSFSLANAVDESKARAKYADGVLELMLPQKSGSASKRVAIS
ncbi:MAG: Hsp20/alpha crystallin family protein [Burkholderiaceae bacterium]|nr:Hsp20/alpha crystallin family protein [Burkholderiaceae bacterium]